MADNDEQFIHRSATNHRKSDIMRRLQWGKKFKQTENFNTKEQFNEY